MQHIATFLSGVMFAVGLGIANMTNPNKVIAFLDVSGSWDPSLALVMAGAVSVYFVMYQLILRRSAPVLAPGFALPTRHDIDRPLAVGAVLFGAGWGLSGFCPGPAITAAVTGDGSVLIFVLAMATGMYVFEVLGVRFAAEPDGGAGLLDQPAATVAPANASASAA